MPTDLALVPTAATSAPGPNFAAADERLTGDWDSDGTVSIVIPSDVADRLLALQGWTIEPMHRGGHAYVKPGCKLRSKGGQPMVDYVWERDDALQIALCAEALR